MGNERAGTVKTLDVIHNELRELAQKKLRDGQPAYLFRGERINYPTTLSSADRHYHSENLEWEIVSELDEITFFVMSQPIHFLGEQLPARLAGAFAQHFGFPTQIFDFTASPDVAIYFASNRITHKNKSEIGTIGILDVEAAEKSKAVVLFDLRRFAQALRARRQDAFGMIYSAFDIEDFTDLKRRDIANRIGLTWQLFAHLPDDETYLYLIGANKDLESKEGDKFADVPEKMIKEYVATSGKPLSPEAAKILVW